MSTENEDSEEIDFDAINDDIRDRNTYLIETNSTMMTRARQQAHELYEVAEKFEGLAEAARGLAALHVAASMAMADIAADLLRSEFDVQVIESEDDETEEE